MARRPPIGWVSLEQPDAGGGGGARRQHFLIQALREHFDVHVIVADPQAELRIKLPRKAFARLMPEDAAPPLRATRFATRVQKTLQDQGIGVAVIAHLETAAAVEPLLRDPNIRTVLELQNLYSSYYRMQSRVLSAYSWARLESKVFSLISAVSALSEEDRAGVGRSRADTIIVPNGVSLEEWRAARDGPTAGLAFFGSWNHRPNQIGLNWYLREVWPAVRARRASATLHLYGPGEPSLVGVPHDGVVIHGKVERLDTALARHRGIIVPIIVGVGTRVKFIEALAAGVPVISTALGAQGYAVPADAFVRADSAGAFAQASLDLLSDNGGFIGMTALARRYVAQHYQWPVVAAPLVDKIKWLMDGA